METSTLLASYTLLELLKHNLHLLSHEVLNLGLELGELATDAVSSTTSSVLGLDELISDFFLNLGDRRDGDGVLRRLLVGLGGLVAALLDNLSEVGKTTTVPCEDVLGVRGDIRESTYSADGDEVGLELLGGDVCNSVGRVLGGLKRQVISKETSDVGRGHRSTRNGVGGVLRANPCGEDVEAGGKDVVALSVVGKVGTLIK